jgi:D-alanyl-D-alanine carboxypeptidase
MPVDSTGDAADVAPHPAGIALAKPRGASAMPFCSRPVAAALVAACGVFSAVLPAAQAGPVLLLEADSGRVLFADNQDDAWFPASLTKIMTAYLAFDALKAGRLSPTDTVVMSELAHVQAPSKLGLPVGTEISVDLAIRAVVVKSANDAAVMLAEKISGSEAGFVGLMNATAKRLGMTRTHFVNANGLPVAGQVSTARDLAILARAVLREFPQHNELWGMREVQVGNQNLHSHNKLLRTFEGADGIKTGFICDAGFNVVASATRDGKRLIAVVLGEPSEKERSARAASLLEHGFEIAAWKAELGSSTLDRLPLDPAAKPVQSVRSSVKAWACNPPPKTARKGVKRKARPTAAHKDGAAGKGQAATSRGERKAVTIMVPADGASKAPQ